MLRKKATENANTLTHLLCTIPRRSKRRKNEPKLSKFEQPQPFYKHASTRIQLENVNIEYAKEVVRFLRFKYVSTSVLRLL